MRKIAFVAACGAICSSAAAQGPKGPPTSGFYNGGKGNGMQARVVRQDSYRFHGHRFPAEIDDITVRDCTGSHTYVTGADSSPLEDGKATFSGRGARVRHFNGSEPFLHSYKHYSGTLTLHASTGSITYRVSGCPQRTLHLTKLE